MTNVTDKMSHRQNDEQERRPPFNDDKEKSTTHDTSSSNKQYDYLTKMFQPPKGTKFATARTKNEISKFEANKLGGLGGVSASMLTPGLKQELQILEKQKTSVSHGPTCIASSSSNRSPELVDLESISSQEKSSNESRDRGNREVSQTLRSSDRSKTGPSSERRRTRSRSRDRSGSRKQYEPSSSHRYHRSPEQGRFETRGRHLHRFSSHRGDSRDNVGRNRDFGSRDSRNTDSLEPFVRNNRGHGRSTRPFAPRGRGSNFQRGSISGRGGGSVNQRNHQNNRRPWNDNRSYSKNLGARSSNTEQHAPGTSIQSEPTQKQFQNTRGLQLMDKLDKLNMVSRFLETARIYETKIEPAEQAKLKERQKLSMILPKTADEDTIAKTLESNMLCVKNLKDVTSHKRLASLVCTMRYFLGQLNVDISSHDKYFEQYLSSFCATMGWDPIGAEAALTLDVKEKWDVFKDYSYSPGDDFKCKKCSIVYPSSKFKCITCQQLFTCLPDLFSHEFIMHRKLVQPSFQCFVCQSQFGSDPVSFARHFTLEHVCSAGHSECALGCKTLIAGSSYIDLENHTASQHNCKICGDLIGNSLRQHLDFFHSLMKTSDYLPEVYFEPIVDEELAKLNDLLNTFEEVKRKNPQIFDECAEVESPIKSPPSSSNVDSTASFSEFDLKNFEPMKNIHRYLTSDETHTITSLNLCASSDTSEHRLTQLSDLTEEETCLYMDTSRDPRLKSEFYKSSTFFLSLNHNSFNSNESSLEERLFNTSSNLTPWRSSGIHQEFKILKYKTAFNDIFQTHENQIRAIPIQKEDSTLKNRLCPIPAKSRRSDSYREEPVELIVDSNPSMKFRRSESSSINSRTSFPPLPMPPEPAVQKATSEWDPRFDRIIHEFGEPALRTPPPQSKSTTRNEIPKFGVDFRTPPEKLTEQIATSQSKPAVIDRDPRLKRSSSSSSCSETAVRRSSSSINQNTAVENSTEIERKRMEQTMALYLAKQKPN